MIKFLILLLLFPPFCNAWTTRHHDSKTNSTTEIHYESHSNFIVYEYGAEGFIVSKTPYKNNLINGTAYKYNSSGRPTQILFYKDNQLVQKMSYSDFLKKSEEQLASASSPLSFKKFTKNYEAPLKTIWQNKYSIAAFFVFLLILKKFFGSRSRSGSTRFSHIKNMVRYSAEPELLQPIPRNVAVTFLFKRIVFQGVVISSLIVLSLFFNSAIYFAILVVFYFAHKNYVAFQQIYILKYGSLVTGTINAIEFYRKSSATKTRVSLSYSYKNKKYLKILEFRNSNSLLSLHDEVSVLIHPNKPESVIIYELAPTKVLMAS